MRSGTPALVSPSPGRGVSECSRWKLRRTPVGLRVCSVLSRLFPQRALLRVDALFSPLPPSLPHGFYFLPNTTTAHVCRGNTAPACFGLRAGVGTRLGSADGRLEALEKIPEMAHQKLLFCKVCLPAFFPPSACFVFICWKFLNYFRGRWWWAGWTGAGRERPSLNVVPITAFIMGLSSAVLDLQQHPPTPPFHAAERLAPSLHACVCACMCVQSILISAGRERSTECEDGPSGLRLLLVKM